jgi:molybdenum-dependent DNA-binding transcriptional regulator ModE
MEQNRTSPAAAGPAPRTHADYRWTLPKALAFLEALAECGTVAEAARRVGMSRQSAYRLRARLNGGPLGEGWDLARRAGVETRRRHRPRSRREGAGLDKVTLSPPK